MSNPVEVTCCECRDTFFYPSGEAKRIKCDDCKGKRFMATMREIASRCTYCGHDFTYLVKKSRVGGRPRTICPDCVRSRKAEKRRNDQKRRIRAVGRLVLVPPERSLEEMRRTGMTLDERRWLRHQLSDRARVRAVREDKLGRMNGL